jgi:Transglutaminase-like superfamily
MVGSTWFFVSQLRRTSPSRLIEAGRCARALLRAKMGLKREHGAEHWLVGPRVWPSAGVNPTAVIRTCSTIDRMGTLLLGHDQCLVKAIALRAVLARMGVATTLRLGARLGSETLQAHAWLEQDGTVILGRLPDLESYGPLAPVT